MNTIASAEVRPVSSARTSRRKALSPPLPDGEEILPLTGPEMDQTLRDLADLANRYPFRWFSQKKVARICGFGDDVLSALAAIGAPVIARKCNPHLLQKWLEANLEKVGKIRAP